MNVLKQFHLTQRPILRPSALSSSSGSTAAAVDMSEGVVIHFSRKLPSDILRKPRKEALTSSLANLEEEAELDAPVELGAAAAVVASGEAQAQEQAKGPAVAAAPTIVDKRHTVDYDRDAIMARIRGFSVNPIMDIRLPESEIAATEAVVKESAEIESEAPPGVMPEVIKLGKRAILPSDEVVKQSKASAAVAIAEASQPADFEEMRQNAPPPEQDALVPPKKRVIRPKPKGAAAAAAAALSSGTVSAAASSVKAIVKEIKERDDSTVNIAAYKVGDTIVATRLPPPRPLPQVQASEFYMNNRARFVQYINALFRPYREELTSGEGDITCESLYGGDDSASVALLTHQKIVRDYLNIYSPYRGLLLFHGLGSGKTCSSIAIAEGLKTFKRIIVMTPASLRMNYIEEMKTKCGDLMYKKNQYWEFIDSRGNPELTRVLSQILMFPDDKFVRANGGAWMVNVTKPSNYETELTPSQRVRVDRQIDEMINTKYDFINYNGLRAEKLKSMTDGYTRNPFDNAVIVIDEAHNFVSRIVNKLKRATSMAYRLYNFLLSAQNAKVVLLTGTPIINYPNEIAVLFNILRGNIDNWVFTVSEGGAARRVRRVPAVDV
jgi:hypothetical protein